MGILGVTTTDVCYPWSGFRVLKAVLCKLKTIWFAWQMCSFFLIILQRQFAAAAALEQMECVFRPLLILAAIPSQFFV